MESAVYHVASPKGKTSSLGNLCASIYGLTFLTLLCVDWHEIPPAAALFPLALLPPLHSGA